MGMRWRLLGLRVRRGLVWVVECGLGKGGVVITQCNVAISNHISSK